MKRKKKIHVNIGVAKKVTPCCKTKLWHFVNRVELPPFGIVRCELCDKEMDAELLETVVRSLNPVTYFCDRCHTSALIESFHSTK